MGKRRALGKGLDALFPDISSEMEEQRDGATITCPIESIQPNPYQPRKTFDPDRLGELISSIRSSGVIQPLVVRKHPDGFELIAGERRWRAAIKAGLREVPIVIKNVSNDQALQLSLVENLQRENLNPIEEANAYRQLAEEFNFSQESIAEIVGKNRSTITNTLRLNRLPENMKNDLASGRISPGHARAILSLEANADKNRLYQEILKRNLSVRQAEAAAKRLSKQKSAPARAKGDAQTSFLREKLQRLLGTQVRIVKRGNRGKIEISFFSEEELERLANVFQKGTK
ncbi:MAG: ParB/RepB/Spo0J family partition protein [Deltaproteobacteria bacterium]|nr:ParB/RepB/Spo0J family partition protein [Deltaproteobacteria bacterium]